MHGLPLIITLFSRKAVCRSATNIMFATHRNFFSPKPLELRSPAISFCQLSSVWIQNHYTKMLSFGGCQDGRVRFPVEGSVIQLSHKKLHTVSGPEQSSHVFVSVCYRLSSPHKSLTSTKSLYSEIPQAVSVHAVFMKFGGAILTPLVFASVPCNLVHSGGVC